MKRSALALAAVAITAVGTVGVTAPASAAIAGHGQTPTAVHAGTMKAGVKAPLTVEKRKVLSLIAHKDAALARVAKKLTRSGLALDVSEAVAANVSGDRLALVELKESVETAGTVAEVRTIGAQVHQVGPSVYSAVIEGLRQTAHFDGLTAANVAAVAAVKAQADAKALDGFDVAAVVDMLIAATVANDAAAFHSAAAVQKGVALTALSSSEDRAAFNADISAAESLLASVEQQLQTANDALAAMVTVDSPVVANPVA